MTMDEWRLYKNSDVYKIEQKEIKERNARIKASREFAKQFSIKNVDKTKKAYTYSYNIKIPPLAPKRYDFFINGISASIPYDSNIPIEDKNNNITKLIIAIHSSNHNADMYLTNTATLAKRVAKLDTTLIVAPQLLITSLLDDSSNIDFLYWEVPPFLGSSKAYYDNEKVRVSAFEVLDSLIEDIVRSGNFVNLKDIVIFGHSAGGQMVNRYAAYSQFPKYGIDVRYIVMAPSSYLYFDKKRFSTSRNQFVTPNIPSKKYNRWGYGMEKLYSVHKRNHITARMMRNQYADSEVVYLVGDKDNNPHDSSLSRRVGANLQGTHRLERAKIYYNYLQYYFGNKITKKQHLHIVNNVGHSSKGLMNSKYGRKYLFTK